MEYLMSDDMFQSTTEILKTVLTSNFMMIGTAIAFIACFIASFIRYVKRIGNEDKHE